MKTSPVTEILPSPLSSNLAWSNTLRFGNLTDHFSKLTFGDEDVSVLITPSEGRAARAHFIYAPGAGSSIDDGFGKFLAARLSTSGIATVRFQFPYMEARKRRPDAPRLLESTWCEIIETVRVDASKIVIGGRSMGVAQGIVVDALALFAYPLRPPGNPDKVRNGHFPNIGIPTLFCSGTKDSFGAPQELEAAAADVSRSTLYFLEGADHGFAISKASGKTREDVWEEAVGATLGWLQSLWD